LTGCHRDLSQSGPDKNQIHSNEWANYDFTPKNESESSGDNYSLSFDGVDDYVVFDNSVIPSTGDVTVQVWGYIDEYTNSGNGYANLLTQGTGDNAYFIGYEDDLQMRLNHEWSDIAVAFPLDEWVCITIVKNDNGTKMYHNASLVAENGTTMLPGDNLTYIGVQYNGYFENWNGNIDEIRIWDIELDADQIQSNYNTELEGNEAGLVGYWNFNEGEGNNLLDLLHYL
jgi:hypothetical protein